ncbi:Gluconate dehydrogenase subunit (plasmid) [Sodalis praecaptivus]|uniref:Gluconate dehydrogenase subunit n=1 Tax=Sodalis praecaptivus TaxID=1239307 RepID=W0I3Q5_9GAMM|nr:sorbitol dehydrogenase family protein [Sodalis praecaptivus]AHF79100.1 Gluconate dehydrogenase subunit [Sodalis praecaptivus]
MRLLSRRQWLVGAAGVLAAAISSQYLRQFFTYLQPAALPTAAPLLPVSAPFMAVSKKLTGIDKLQPDLAFALYRSLYHPQLDAQLEALLSRLDEQHGSAGPPWLEVLAQQSPPLRQLYHQLINGWYLGVVGQGDNLRCIAFENLVSYRLLHHVLLPPSYAPGPPNFWVKKPGAEVSAHG